MLRGGHERLRQQAGQAQTVLRHSPQLAGCRAALNCGQAGLALLAGFVGNRLQQGLHQPGRRASGLAVGHPGRLRFAGEGVNRDGEGAEHDVVRVEFHHLARQSGRTELDDFRLGEHLAGRADVGTGAVQHVADVRDVIDDQAAPFDGQGDRVPGVVETGGHFFLDDAAIGVGRSGQQGEAEQRGKQAHGGARSVIAGITL